jgi:Flp pilus assembly protein TadB
MQSAFSVLTCFSIAALLLSFLIPTYGKRKEATSDSQRVR